MNAWTTKVLDLDNVLVDATTESQKCIWFVRAITPKTLLSIIISLFEASEKLTKLSIGIIYVNAPFSISRTTLFVLTRPSTSSHNFTLTRLIQPKDTV
jgi:hypothetical protein